MTDEVNLQLSHKQFAYLFGMFYQFWSLAEMISSLGIGILLKLNDEETHLVTARMEFARKAALIRHLVAKKSHNKSTEIKTALNKIQNDSKRNVFAHSTVLPIKSGIQFLERDWQGDYTAKIHKFSFDEFNDHVMAFSSSVESLFEAFDLSQERLREFSNAALSANRKAIKSPTPPKSKA